MKTLFYRLVSLSVLSLFLVASADALPRLPRPKPGGGNCDYQLIGCHLLCAIQGSCLFDASICACHDACDSQYQLCFQDPTGTPEIDPAPKS